MRLAIDIIHDVCLVATFLTGRAWDAAVKRWRAKFNERR